MRLAFASSLAAMLVAWTSAATATPPLEAYGRLPSLEQMEISPDGDLLAYVITKGDARYLAVKRLADLKVVQLVKVSDIKLRDLLWADEHHLLIIMSTTALVPGMAGPRQEWSLMNVLDVDSGKQRRLLENLDRSMNVIIGSPSVRVVNGRTVVFSNGGFYVDNATASMGLFRSDIETGAGELIEPGSPDTEGWLVDSSSKPVAESQYEESTGRWTLKIRPAAGAWIASKPIIAPIDPPTLEGLGPDGRTAVVSFDDGTGPVMWQVSLVDGRWGAQTPSPHQWRIFDRTDKVIGSETLEGDDRTIAFSDDRLNRSWAKVTRAFAGASVYPVSWSASGRKLVALLDGGDFGYGYALIDLDTGQAQWLGNIYGEIFPADIAETRPIAYRAADGLEIHGYLTLPPGKPEKALPLIVMPHGGPADRDEPGFDWLSQALASRGYAVLRPNYRGSTGYTEDFEAAGYGQWGRKMQTDLSDGVRDLATRGLIDPKRVCIFGWSYGGYAALAGATLDRGVYRCAVDMAGPSELRRMLASAQSEPFDNNSTLRFWDRFMGAKGPNDSRLDEISPAAQAAKADIPILIVHGEDDTVVPFEQGRIMADALTRAGKAVTFVPLKGEDHWGSRSDTRLQLLKAADLFLETNNPPN